MPYAVLMFQIVSTLLSGVLLLIFGPALVEAVTNGREVWAYDGFMPTYLLMQTLAGVAAIPVWRRRLRNASNDRSGSLLLSCASRV